MSTGSSTQRATAMTEAVATKVRSLIAQHLRVNAERVTDEAHFDDLGADSLDRLELMIVIEDQFAGIEIADEVIEQTTAVGDLIRFLEDADHGRLER
jgi:acyl carrier protein